jgi:hypothetical protein
MWWRAGRRNERLTPAASSQRMRPSQPRARVRVCDAGKAHLLWFRPEGSYLRSIILAHSVTAFLNLLGFFLVRPGEFIACLA